MEIRPKCKNDGCDRLAVSGGKRVDGTRKFKKLCTICHKNKYEMPLNRRDRLVRKFPNLFCILCGWDKGPCDRHRIIYGKNGGQYTDGNVISLCPNCHRLLHLGLISVE